MSDKPTIPQDVKDKIESMPWTYSIYDAGKYGYSLAQQELAEAGKEIERLKVLIETAIIEGWRSSEWPLSSIVQHFKSRHNL